MLSMNAIPSYLSSWTFEKLLYGYFSEARLDRIELPEDCPNTIRVFVKWIYTGVIEEAAHYEADPVYHEKL
jgi:hypothetical protein